VPTKHSWRQSKLPAREQDLIFSSLLFSLKVARRRQAGRKLVNL
jgi:hypothetical protein